MASPAKICVTVLAVTVACSGQPDRARASKGSEHVGSAPLAATDFVVDGVPDGADSSAVRRALGPPDSVWVGKHPYDTDATLATWRFPDLLVGYQSDGHVYQLTVETNAIPTARGLRVGDTEARVRALYGLPADTVDGAWEYRDPSEPTGHHVMRVSLRAGRVTSMFFGTLLD